MLIGSPIAGAILDAQSQADKEGHLVLGKADFTGVLVFTGVVLVASGVLMSGTRFWKAGLGLKKA